MNTLKWIKTDDIWYAPPRETGDWTGGCMRVHTPSRLASVK